MLKRLNLVGRCWVLLFKSLCVLVCVGDFGRHLTLCCPLPRPWLSGKSDRRLSPPVCWLIYCSPTHRWEINGKPSVRRQYNKWPIQTSTRSSPEGSEALAAAGPPRLGGDKKVPVQPPRGQMLVQVRLHVIPCDNVGWCCRAWCM